MQIETKPSTPYPEKKTRGPLRYFVKELVSTRLWSTKGYVIPFEVIGDDTGLLITDHPGLIEELELAMAARRGGVYEIKEADVEPLKKKVISEQRKRESISNDSMQKLRLETTRPFQNPAPTPAGVPVAAVDSAQPSTPAPPLNPSPVVDPAMLRPKPKRKSALSSEAPAPPKPTTETVLPT